MMEKEEVQDNAKYTRRNGTQILKIRHLIRKNGYFDNHKSSDVQHKDIEQSISLDADLLDINEIGNNNVRRYMAIKEDGKENTLRVAYVTESEKEEAEKIENKTVAELKTNIFEFIHKLPMEMQDIMEDVFKRKIKNKQKKDYIKFFYELFELVHSKSHGSDSDDDGFDDNEEE